MKTSLHPIRTPAKIAATSLAIAFFPMIIGAVPIPSSVKTTTFNNDYDPSFHASVQVYSDGFEREIRTLFKEGAGDLVSGIQFDIFGRPIIKTKPYYSTSHNHEWLATADPVAEANAYFDGSSDERPDADNKAFTESEFYPDILGRVKRIGKPGDEFSLAQSAYRKHWYFGVSAANFIANPTEAGLDSKFSNNDAQYALLVEKDPDGAFIQVVKDKFGNIVKTWEDPDPQTAGDEIVQQFSYDVLGNLLLKNPPGNGGQPDPWMPTEYLYSTDGTIRMEKHPDAGRSEFIHDMAGRLRFMQSELQMQTPGVASFDYRKYDRLDRLLEEGTIRSSPEESGALFTQDNANNADFPGNQSYVTVHTKYFYDRIDGLAGQLEVPQTLLKDGNIHGKLVARVAYNRLCWGGMGFSVVEIFSYHPDGNIASRTIKMPISAGFTENFTYDLQGRRKSKITETQWSSPRTKEYIYDGQGRLQSLLQNGSTVAEYEYTKTGLLSERIFPVGRVSMRYNIRNWPTRIIGNNSIQNTYEQTLFYEQSSSPRFGGEITRSIQKYTENDGSTRNFDLSYAYDGARRLKATNYQFAIFQEAYAYDAKGRITQLREGIRDYTYDYDLATNRILRIEGDPARANVNDNFVYDPNGNMVFDRSKKMAIQYNWRNLPAKFIFYKDLSSLENTTPLWHSVHLLGELRATVEVAYDADGKRMFKETYHW